MVIQQGLLDIAQAAGVRLAAAERQVEIVRAEYHSVVRRLHLAGASLRELAAALDLSHQRVQQMVSGAGGSWWRRAWRSRTARGNLACTFCKLGEDEVSRLIAGPKVFICDTCVAAAEHAASGDAAAAVPGRMALAGSGTRSRCSFCGKRCAADRPLVTGPGANICVQCLEVCRQILIDSASE